MTNDNASAAIVLPRESTAIACPLLDRRPVPRWSTTDRPAGLGEQITVPPDIGGLALHAEALGDLGDAHGVARFHGDDCSERLDKCLPCSDNNYMTNSTNHPLIGRKVRALTNADKAVVISVTAVEAEHDHGTEVWGYRVATKQRRNASTAYPRRYFVPTEGEG